MAEHQVISSTVMISGIVPSPAPIQIPGKMTAAFSADLTSGQHRFRNRSLITLQETRYPGSGISKTAPYQEPGR